MLVLVRVCDMIVIAADLAGVLVIVLVLARLARPSPTRTLISRQSSQGRGYEIVGRGHSYST